MKVNLNKPVLANAGAASGKSDIIIIDVQDIEVFPQSDENGVVMEGSFVLAAGEKMYKIYGTKSKTEASMETEGDEDMMSFKSKIVVMHPGNTREVKEFVQEWTGKDIIVMHKGCGESTWEVMGTPCAPLQLKTTKKDDNDGRSYNLTFEPFAKSGFVPKIYEGAVVFAEPFVVAAADAVVLSPANGLQYRLPALAVTEVIGFDGVTLEHGKTVTLIGQGGAAPATLASAVSGDATVVLKDATTWVAVAKAVIHLKVFKAGATTYLFELSRE